MPGKSPSLSFALAIALALTGCITPDFRSVNSVLDGKALVYFYRKANISGAAGKHQIYVNDKLVGILPNGGYFPYFAAPGTNLVTSSFGTTMIINGVPVPKSFLDGPRLFNLTAEEGRRYYLKFVIATTWGPRMLQVDTNTGAREVEKCRIVQSSQ
jgi:hypothetical protein